MGSDGERRVVPGLLLRVDLSIGVPALPPITRRCVAPPAAQRQAHPQPLEQVAVERVEVAVGE
jgi:hypothetical protein